MLMVGLICVVNKPSMVLSSQAVFDENRLKELCHGNGSLKNLANFFKFVIRSPSQSFSVVAVLVHFQCYALVLCLFYHWKLFL